MRAYDGVYCAVIMHELWFFVDIKDDMLYYFSIEWFLKEHWFGFWR